MKKYPKYKDSGIEWIGEIPEHWEVKRLDLVVNIVRGNSTFKKDELLDKGEYIALQYGKTYKVDVVDENFKYFVNSEFYKESQVVSRGDTILISTSETIEDLGHTCYYDNENIGLIGGEQILLNPNHEVVSGKYLYYFTCRLGSQLKKYAKGLKVFRFNTNDLKCFSIALAPLQEQKQIADYLTNKTTEIDKLIAEKEELITLYKEEKVATINHVVTKGLDAAVPMKDSGIEWIGEIPEHWEVKKLKYVTSLKSGDNITSEQIQQNGKYPVYGGNGKRGFTETFTHKGNYVLIGRQGALCGNINYASGYFWASEHAVVCSITSNHNYIWLGCLLEIMNLNQYSQSSAQPGLAVEKIKNLDIVVPLEKETREIANFLSQKTSEIDSKMNTTHKEIALLKEYKEALISEVVLGKVDVRGEVER